MQLPLTALPSPLGSIPLDASTLIAVLVALLAWLVLNRLLFGGSSSRKLPPTPPAHVLFGNIPVIAKAAATGEHIDETLARMRPQLGPIFQLKLKLLTMTVLTDPEDIREVRRPACVVPHHCP